MLLEKMDPNPREEDGLTPLDLALSDGNMVAVKHLVSAGGISSCFYFFGDQIPSNGWTALHRCIDKPEFLPYFCEKIPVDTVEENNQWTPLHRAARFLTFLPHP